MLKAVALVAHLDIARFLTCEILRHRLPTNKSVSTEAKSLVPPLSLFSLARNLPENGALRYSC